MIHDLVAELGGLRAELVQARDAQHAAEVGDAIKTLVAAIRAQLSGQEAEASAHEAGGRTVLAATARQRAAVLSAAVPADETAVDTTPRQTATSRKGR